MKKYPDKTYKKTISLVSLLAKPKVLILMTCQVSQEPVFVILEQCVQIIKKGIGLGEALVMVGEVYIDREIKIEKQMGRRADLLLWENMKMGMCWHVKTLQEMALEDRIVVGFLAEMNAEFHKDGTDSGGIS